MDTNLPTTSPWGRLVLALSVIVLIWHLYLIYVPLELVQTGAMHAMFFLVWVAAPLALVAGGFFSRSRMRLARFLFVVAGASGLIVLTKMTPFWILFAPVVVLGVCGLVALEFIRPAGESSC